MSPSSQPVALVIGASRGIGRQVAVDLAKAGYATAVAAKSISDAYNTHPFPPGPNSSRSTINTVEREIKELGGKAFAVTVDTRDPESVRHGVDAVVAKYGRLDVIVYNSGAIWWASVENSPFKRFQLMQQVNIEGLYATVQASLPHFKAQNWNGRIIVVSPPIYNRFFRGKTAYAIGKIGMSVLVKGLAMDWEREKKRNMAICAIWPAAAIESAATVRETESNPQMAERLRKPTIYSDAILAMLHAPTSIVNGQLFLDEDFLREHCGVADFSNYSLVPGSTPRRIMPSKLPDLTVAEQDDEGDRMDSAKLRASKL